MVAISCKSENKHGQIFVFGCTFEIVFLFGGAEAKIKKRLHVNKAAGPIIRGSLYCGVRGGLLRLNQSQTELKSESTRKSMTCYQSFAGEVETYTI